MKNFIVSIIFGILVITAAYHQRGYWAVGAEVVLPVIFLAVLLKGERAK